MSRALEQRGSLKQQGRRRAELASRLMTEKRPPALASLPSSRRAAQSMTNVLPLRDSKGFLWERGKRQRPSEGELADRLADLHSKEIRFLAAAGRAYRQPAR